MTAKCCKNIRHASVNRLWGVLNLAFKQNCLFLYPFLGLFRSILFGWLDRFLYRFQSVALIIIPTRDYNQIAVTAAFSDRCHCFQRSFVCFIDLRYYKAYRQLRQKAITTPNNLSPKILPITDKNGTAIADSAAIAFTCFSSILTRTSEPTSSPFSFR